MNRSAEIVNLQRRAAELMRAERTVEAIAAYENLLGQAPDLAESWFNLGWLRKKDRRFPDALDAYEEAIRRGVSAPEEVYCNRATILSADLARDEDAIQELNKALAINPDYLPALLNLGNLQEDLGLRDAAKISYTHALDVAPDHALALARLAGVSEPKESADPLIGKIEGALRRRELSAADRSDLGFALGRLLDLCNEYEKAFEAYHAANEACEAAFGISGSPYDPEAAEKAITILMESFTQAELMQLHTQACDRDSPIFICGMFRSGSTLVEQLLSKHQQVTAGGELDILPALLVRKWRDFPAGAAELSASAILELRNVYEEELHRKFSIRGYITDKRPDNFLLIGLIKKIYPKARIINTIRNPCDNILSIYFHPLGVEFPYSTRLENIAHWYEQYLRLMRHWKNIYGDSIYDMEYDALIENPEYEVERLLSFLGLPWEEACLSPQGNKAAVRTGSVWQVRQSLYRTSSGRWRNYATQMRAYSKRFACK